MSFSLAGYFGALHLCPRAQTPATAPMDPNIIHDEFVHERIRGLALVQRHDTPSALQTLGHAPLAPSTALTNVMSAEQS